MSGDLADRLRDLAEEVEQATGAYRQTPRPVTPPISYAEFRGYSVLHDCEMVRLSVADRHGREFFMRLPASTGRPWRDRRAQALDDIETAIAQGLDPGEVRVLQESE